jgi:hypothetical protein
MNTKRITFVMIGVLILLVLAVCGSAYIASGMLDKRAKTLSDLKLKNEVLAAEQHSLVKAKEDVAKYAPLASIAKTIVPQDKDQAQAVREIINLANESGITPSSITFPSSNLGSPVAAGAATGAPVAGAAAKNNLSQLLPVKGNPGLYILQITITQDATSAVPYDRFVAFLDKLEQNRRTAQVSNVVLQPSATSRNMLSFTLTVNQYIKP